MDNAQSGARPVGSPFELACVTGRFQPLHLDHLDLMLRARAESHHLVVGITNPDPRGRAPDDRSAHRHLAAANPFTFRERLRMVESALRACGVLGEEFDVVPFPLEAPEVWHHYVPPEAVQFVRTLGPWERAKAERLAAGGYGVRCVSPPAGPRPSGTAVRAALAAGCGSWRADVPAAVVTLVGEFLRRVPLDGRG